MDCENYEPIYREFIYRQLGSHGDKIETTSPVLYAEFCNARKDYINKSIDCEECTISSKSKISAPYELPMAV